MSAEDLMLEKLRKEHENIKFWGPVLLLYPLGPVCVATTTVVFGGVIVNVASMECNAKIDSKSLKNTTVNSDTNAP